ARTVSEGPCAARRRLVDPWSREGKRWEFAGGAETVARMSQRVRAKRGPIINSTICGIPRVSLTLTRATTRGRRRQPIHALASSEGRNHLTWPKESRHAGFYLYATNRRRVGRARTHP